MTNDFLFQFTNDPGGSPCRYCQMPAKFLAGYPDLGIGYPYCETCITAHVLQSLKNEGASLRCIEAGFFKLSELVDAPVSSVVQ